MVCGLRTADHGLDIKHGLGYKTWTKHYGLGIKYGLRYKTRTEHNGLFAVYIASRDTREIVCRKILPNTKSGYNKESGQGL